VVNLTPRLFNLRERIPVSTRYGVERAPDSVSMFRRREKTLTPVGIQNSCRSAQSLGTMPTSWSRSLKKQKNRKETRGTNLVPSDHQSATAYDSSKVVVSSCSRSRISTDCTLHYAYVVVLCMDDRAGIGCAWTNSQNKGTNDSSGCRIRGYTVMGNKRSHFIIKTQGRSAEPIFVCKTRKCQRWSTLKGIFVTLLLM
jgi:hypothetical protein